MPQKKILVIDSDVASREDYRNSILMCFRQALVEKA
jgi:hypothetical protein